MTLPQNQVSPANSPLSMDASSIGEAPLQAFIRRLHESRHTLSTDEEPERGTDPWQGIGL